MVLCGGRKKNMKVFLSIGLTIIAVVITYHIHRRARCRKLAKRIEKALTEAAPLNFTFQKQTHRLSGTYTFQVWDKEANFLLVKISVGTIDVFMDVLGAGYHQASIHDDTQINFGLSLILDHVTGGTRKLQA